MSARARLLFPAIRWSEGRGYVCEGIDIDDALALGVGGFCIFGGRADAARELTSELRARSRVPLLIASDLERGAGQQLAGATQLPPLAAIGSLDDLDATRRAAEITAREALALGVNWVFAPVADVDLEPRNPIVGTRAFGADPEAVARHVTAWVYGCHDAGALACAKHFPGHGRTYEDSHAALPHVAAARAELELDLRPFRAAIAAGVDAVMTAHVAYRALDPSGAPATLSEPILRRLLRDELGFNGLVVSDAFIMEGVIGAGGEREAAVRAIRAGCDAVLYPSDARAVLAALDAANVNADASLARIEAAAARPMPAAAAHDDDAHWAEELADRTIVHVRGERSVPRRMALVEIDDDAGGPYAPPARAAFEATLRASGIEIDSSAPVKLIALYADIRAWKGQPGLTESGRVRLAQALETWPDARVMLFGHPRLADGIGAANVAAAWGGEALMQRAAARWLAREARV